MKKRSKKTTRIVTNARKCPTTHKSMFSDEKTANRVMMRIWSHDSKADIRDLHTYICPDCGSYHVGHKSYYQAKLQKEVLDEKSVQLGREQAQIRGADQSSGARETV